MSRRAVFLDRDGVINRALVRAGRPYPPRCLEDLEILPGVPEALADLRAAGYDLIVVTNQPDVARGLLTRQVVEAMHAALQAQLPLDEMRACYHDDADHCLCRKPAPGLLTAAAAERGIDLKASFMVGDRWRDILAGHQAGCTTILVDYAYDEVEKVRPDKRVASLAEAARWILDQGQQEVKDETAGSDEC